jgi:glycosyltransferase involved in cell wall biosynthesis
LSYIRQRARVRHQTRTGLEQCPALILRIPAIAAWSVFQLREPRRPFGVEVVGDPWEVFAPGRMRTPWRALLRHRQRSIQRRLVRGACAAAYVTRHALQRRYPPPAEGHTTSYSSVVLQEQDFASRPRGFETGGETPRLVTVGSLHQTYKGVDTLLQAIALYCRSWGPLRLLVVGDGKLRPNLERQCRRLGIQDCVDFVGRVADARIVRTYLDQSDMFVLASRTEGLPRAMLEAMARGLPCLGTDVGGITELLDASDLFPADRPEQLAGKLRESLRNPQRLAQMAHRNWSRAKDYREQLLRPRRNLFYSHVAQATQHWLDQIEGGPT